MNVTSILQTLFHANQLKRTARTGWVQRGVPNAEDVAAHSYGVIFTTMLLAELVDAEIDLGRALALATLHDLPEGLTTDIPTPAWRYLPKGIKMDVERGAMQEILAGADFSDSWLALWEELHGNKTAVARLVHDADKLDMFVQAFIYEQQTGNVHLQEFWERPYTFHFPQAQAIFDDLRQRREDLAGFPPGHK